MRPLPCPSAAALLGWYDRHRRSMPWRALPGETPDPYRVWLSEIMLQQTTVATVGPYFARFLERFPTIERLAAADEDSVLQAWAGLGYYARARNLHRCARAVAEAGSFPRDLAGLRRLPGIGAYTAASVASIAFGVPAVAVDGNVERIVARVFGIEAPLPGARRAIEAAAARLGEDPAARGRPGDFTQALFDLGALVCTPRAPSCGACPWEGSCAARARGQEAALPRKAERKARPGRHGAHFWLEDEAGAVLLRRRPSQGLLGGMLEFPGTDWRDERWGLAEALAQAPQAAEWRLAGRAQHEFTHFTLELDVYAARVRRIVADGLVVPGAALASAALPTVMRRCAGVVQKSGDLFTRF